MRNFSHAHVALLTIATLAGLSPGSPAHRAARNPSSAPDSVTVRVMFKSWGGELEQCTGLNWGWDSLTWRLRPGEMVPHAFAFARPEFRIGWESSADSAWLIVQPGRFTISDSLRITSQWTPTFTTVGIKDAQTWLRVRLIDPWPELAQRPTKTVRLSGRVVDDSTGCGVFFCQVVVLGTKFTTYSDTLGHFDLDVPVGDIGVETCAAGYASAHSDVHAPRDSFVVRLGRDPRVLVTRPCR